MLQLLIFICDIKHNFDFTLVNIVIGEKKTRNILEIYMFLFYTKILFFNS